MEIVRLASDELLVQKRLDLLRFDQNDAVGILHFAFDDEKRFLRDHEPQLLKQIGRHDRIRDAGFIFQTDEDKSLRCARPLPANDIAGNLTIDFGRA